MIAAIRISGKVKIRYDVEETLFRLRLRKKFTCILINEKDKEQLGMIRKVKNYIAYGSLDEKTLILLLEKRAKKTDNTKLDAKKTAEEMIKGKNLEELGIKPFFRLHPPRKGLKDSKSSYPKGVLGDNKEISKLIERMV